MRGEAIGSDDDQVAVASAARILDTELVAIQYQLREALEDIVSQPINLAARADREDVFAHDTQPPQRTEGVCLVIFQYPARGFELRLCRRTPVELGNGAALTEH